MMAYRNVPREDIINSLINACELAQKNSPGPACDEAIDNILDAVPYLQAAADVEIFKRGLNGERIPMLRKMRELFELYATVTDEGRQIFKDLNAWGAFDGMVTHEPSPVINEVKAYRFITGIRYIGDVDTNEVRALINSKFSQVEEDKKENGIAELVYLVSLAQVGGTDKQLIDIFTAMNPGSAETKIIYVAVDHYITDPSLYEECKPLFDKYGIVLSEDTPAIAFDVGAMHKNNEALIKKVDKILAPFWEKEETIFSRISSMGLLTSDRDGPKGITFYGMEHVAQVIANAFPDQKVMRSNATVIAPVASKPVPKDPKPPAM